MDSIIIKKLKTLFYRLYERESELKNESEDRRDSRDFNLYEIIEHESNLKAEIKEIEEQIIKICQN